MTNKEFNELLNDIDDKLVEEDMAEKDIVYPVKVKETVKKFNWRTAAAAAAVCIAAVGGTVALIGFYGGGGGGVMTPSYAVESGNTAFGAETDPSDNEAVKPTQIAAPAEATAPADATVPADISAAEATVPAIVTAPPDTTASTGAVTGENTNPISTFITEEIDIPDETMEADPYATVPPMTAAVAPMPPLTALDGSVVADDEILQYDPAYFPQTYDHYTVDFCYAVPFFTPKEDRAAYEEGAWFKLKKDSHIGGFTVTNAYSDYFVENSSVSSFNYRYQGSVSLSGDFNSIATARKEYAPNGDYNCIMLTLYGEYCQELFSLMPMYKGFNDDDIYGTDFDRESVHILLSEGMSGYYDVFNQLRENDSATVSISADKFTLKLSVETGNTYDSNILMWLDGDYTIETQKGVLPLAGESVQ